MVFQKHQNQNIRTSLLHITTVHWLVAGFSFCPSTNTWLKGLKILGSCSRLLGPLTHYLQCHQMGTKVVGSPRHCCLFSLCQVRSHHGVTKNITSSKKVQTHKEEWPQHSGVFAEKLLRSPIFSFRTTVPRSYLIRAGVLRTVYSQTKHAAALLFSHPTCCLLGLTELWGQVTEVSPVQRQRFVTLHTVHTRH